MERDPSFYFDTVDSVQTWHQDDCSDIDQVVKWPDILEYCDGGGYDDCVCEGANNDDGSNDNDIAKYIT